MKTSGLAKWQRSRNNCRHGWCRIIKGKPINAEKRDENLFKIRCNEESKTSKIGKSEPVIYGGLYR